MVDLYTHCYHLGQFLLSVLYSMAAAASSLTRSSVSFRRQGSSGIVWCDGWIAGQTDGSAGTSALPITNNVDAAHVNIVLSENMPVKLPESGSTNQVLLHSGSLGSNAMLSAGTGHRAQIDREISSSGAPKKPNSRFTRWVKRVTQF